MRFCRSIAISNLNKKINFHRVYLYIILNQINSRFYLYDDIKSNGIACAAFLNPTFQKICLKKFKFFEATIIVYEKDYEICFFFSLIFILFQVFK